MDTTGLPQPTCPPLHRPAMLLTPGAGVHGLRAAGARVVGGARVLDVWLFTDPPPELADPARWTLTPAPGGAAVTVTAAAVVPASAGESAHLELMLDGRPDTGRYRLTVLPAPTTPFDPLRAHLPVRLRPECPDLADCFADEEPPPVPGASPVHDYLARDWRSLRAALLEFHRRENPDADLSIADPSITLLELFAHLGDLLHYRLDRVATEAYLETARRRTSVRRHARLVDYTLAEAASATTYVVLQCRPAINPMPVNPGLVAAVEAGARSGFTLEEYCLVRPPLGEIAVYDWREDLCCLPAGSTECVLVRPRPADSLGDAWLVPGDRIVFEAVDPEDAAHHLAWAHRKPGVDWPAGPLAAPHYRSPVPFIPATVVTLVEVAPFSDPLAGPDLVLTRVRWRTEDALPVSYPVGIDTSTGVPAVVVARGNVVPAHHGRLVNGPPGAVVEADGSGGYLLTAAGTPAEGGPGVARRPDGTPYRMDIRVYLPSGDVVGADWVDSLLTLDAPVRLAAVLETEDDAPPLLRFRTGAVGLAPPLGSRVAAAYEVGGGTAGNIPAGALHVVEDNVSPPGLPPRWREVPGLKARNPVPGTGGTDPAPLDAARRDAPQAYSALPRRAVTVADYAAAAAAVPGVLRAVAQRGWSGSWQVVRAVVETPEDVDGNPEYLPQVQAALDDVRMLGTEAAAVPGTPVGLFVALDVCAAPGHDAEQVRRSILARLRPGTAAHPGLFHPSRLELGTAVYVSAVVAAAAGVPGVDAVEVREARRLSDPPGTLHQVLRVGPTQVPVLDDDPSRPGRGRLDVRVRGGGA
ncbi:baseplate J/gp47 family protein [Yinghuangia seranimata]|uniref:baseplate J/gp47 family protein n=1 Tax=Yinghuangia seranimata TaxID=408067 RepID=UPI00248BAB09|nr:hypothetical protein [Yinghuangia seranimata]MDI2131684.1 hypothetical protein [Yinghuangia seranimata]